MANVQGVPGVSIQKVTQAVLINYTLLHVRALRVV
jgi:hypothetical protein